MIVTYDCNLQSWIRLALGKIINYDRNRKFIVLAIVITIIIYNWKTFIVQATDLAINCYQNIM